MAPAAAWLLRHGRSRANEAGVVVSALEHGTLSEYGLSAQGQAQARAAGRELAAQGPAALAVLASPFSRTLETAALAATELAALAPGCFADGAAADPPPPPRVRAALRERGFGAFELGPAEAAYRQVWERDAEDLNSDFRGVESVAAVARRLLPVVEELRAMTARGESALVVAHGDTLSILTAILRGTPLADHREGGQETGQLVRASWPGPTATRDYRRELEAQGVAFGDAA